MVYSENYLKTQVSLMQLARLLDESMVLPFPLVRECYFCHFFKSGVIFYLKTDIFLEKKTRVQAPSMPVLRDKCGRGIQVAVWSKLTLLCWLFVFTCRPMSVDYGTRSISKPRSSLCKQSRGSIRSSNTELLRSGSTCCCARSSTWAE
jgi:hypothetical protein